MMTKKKKIVIILIAAILLIALLFFAFVIMILTHAIGATSEVIGEAVVGEIAEGIVSGMAEGGKQVAEELVTEVLETIFGGIK